MMRKLPQTSAGKFSDSEGRPVDPNGKTGPGFTQTENYDRNGLTLDCNPPLEYDVRDNETS